MSSRTMRPHIPAFVPVAVLRLDGVQTSRSQMRACSRERGPVRVASAACAALAIAHALTTLVPELHAIPAHATAAEALPSTSDALAAAQSDVDKSAKAEESVAEVRARSERNTRTSGASSRLFSRARRAASEGDLRGAEELYSELTGKAPTFAPGFSNLGNVLVARGAYGEAEGLYTRALELAPRARDSWLVYVNRGAARLARGELRDALDDMNAADALAPAQPAVLSNRGAVWEALGKYENAVRDYQTALDGNDVQPFWLRYGLVLFQKGKSFEAISVLNRVNARFGGDDVAAAQAAVFFDRGELGMAESAWSRVERPRLFEGVDFLAVERKWPPKAVEAMQRFRGAK